jgi:hypothetical protein
MGNSIILLATIRLLSSFIEELGILCTDDNMIIVDQIKLKHDLHSLSIRVSIYGIA